jgi:hypothetical protein
MDNSNLKSVFRFNDEDLDANRNGYMTKRQRVRLRDKRWDRIGPYAGFAALLAFMFVCSLVSSGSRTRPRQDTLSMLGLFFFIFGPMIGVLVLLAYRELRRIKTDLYKGDISIAWGRARLDIMDGGRGPARYKLNIEGIEFDISKMQLLTLRHGERYRVFYAPNSKVILSVESL